ncbi:TetR/AcrR family transcriptional regulator [Kibdelosporangium lantanae]
MTRGRPRSEDAKRAVLSTALSLCERDGYANVTIKAIADEAGVGRQTVYRWWSDKAEIVMDALIDLRERELPTLYRPSGDALADVEAVLRITYEYTQRVTGRALAGLMADAQSEERLSKRLQDTVIGPRRQALRDILQQGVDEGTLAENVPLDLVVDFAWGTMWYRMLSHHAPVDAGLAREVTEAVGLWLRARPAPRT